MKTLKKRRKKYLTDYNKRIKLLKSNSPRIVLRKTNRYFIAQYVLSDEAQDSVKIGFNSKILLNYGWPEKAKNSLKSISAGYLTGYLIGKQIIKNKAEKPIVDFGMMKNLHKTKIYAFLKGLIDSGIKISCKEEFFPSLERLKGGHMKNKIPFEEIKSKIDKK